MSPAEKDTKLNPAANLIAGNRKSKGPAAPPEVLLLEAMSRVNRQATKIGANLRNASATKRVAYTRFITKFGELAAVAEDLIEDNESSITKTD